MKHSTPEFAALAHRGTILRCEIGSTVHGTGLPGQADRDEMGICVEPREYVIGLRQFEQYVFQTSPEGERSGPGDLDLTVYSLRKWTRLALSGNPTVLLALFVSDSHTTHLTDLGRALRANSDRFVSTEAGNRFLGYLRAQRDSMLGLRGGRHTNRPELVREHGFDTKFASHMIRLGVQGVELLETGRISLPMPEPWSSWIRDLRLGRRSRDEALAVAAEQEARLTALLGTADVPARADHAWADAWLVDAYESSWASRDGDREGTAQPG
ncbi:nucleotidyltransferase domain-containing protein [Nocardiopsis ansamitocini]|uniref:Nucleotidyltransferase n=1 Tax=Nocardiopsis ansamitocini TaxID=1670832 RepID=A0A9W6P2H7_9ACTN|nr:nucleotidyltransferase domain-containing protein [Nocardiopsis ansamitocini]GLU46020.1 hypothetical protein Nans01_03710 [Nocardiopsis ansamitocini]